MTIEADIETALFGRVEAFATSIGYDGSLIEWQNKIFAPPTNNQYLSVRHFPNTPINYDWGGDHPILIGILQVTVVWSSNAGTISPTEIAGQIKAYFAKGTMIAAGSKIIKIEVHPTLMSDIQDGQSAQFPVSIPYRCAT